MGAGLIGREHVALVEANPEAALVGIADVSDEAAAFARGRGVPFFRDIEVLLDDTQPDGVIVALPNRLHLEAGLACVTRGIPVLVEKPIADTVGAALALVEAGDLPGTLWKQGLFADAHPR